MKVLNAMRNVSFLLIVLTSFSLFSCTDKDELEVLPTPTDSEPITVSIRLSGLDGLKTKSGMWGPVSPIDTICLNDLAIFVTDKDRVNYGYKTISRYWNYYEWERLVNGDSISIPNIPPTATRVMVLGNVLDYSYYPPQLPIDSLATVINYETTLGTQQWKGHEVIYYGANNLKLVSEPDSFATKTYIAEVNIAPAVARFQIRSIEFVKSDSVTLRKMIDGYEQETTIQWQNFSGSLMGIYMNNFYSMYDLATGAGNLYSNTTGIPNIVDGNWWFNNQTDTANIAASYNNYSNYYYGYDEWGNWYHNWSEEPRYWPLPHDFHQYSDSCYAFNFFPGSVVPSLHFDIDSVYFDYLTSTNSNVFDPSLYEKRRFANVVRYYKNDTTLMSGSDFKPGTIYNMHIKLTPILDFDISSNHHDILVKVIVEPWKEETVTPGFDY